MDNIKLLLENGAQITAFDPAAAKNFQKFFPEGKNDRGVIAYADTPEAALQNADICFVFTEWEEIRRVTPGTFKERMRIPLVYDGRNVYSVKQMTEAGVEYYSIGR